VRPCLVVVEKDPDDDAEEPADLRHGCAPF
jgi:hypothetical protein